MTNKHTPRPKQSIDPLLQQRLQELSSRRPGSSLPPPDETARPGAQARPASRPSAARTSKRVKPARGSKAASLALSVVTTAGLAALFANDDTPTESVVLTGGTTAASATTAPAATSAPSASTTADQSGQGTATTVATVAPSAPAAGTIVDGSYLGSPSRNRWGTVQVQAVYSGGQLVDVQILQYPDGDRRSLSISQRVLPRLITQAISVQSAGVDNVSGATYTSRSYVQSLQSAIDAAKSASGIA